MGNYHSRANCLRKYVRQVIMKMVQNGKIHCLFLPCYRISQSFCLLKTCSLIYINIWKGGKIYYISLLMWLLGCNKELHKLGTWKGHERMGKVASSFSTTNLCFRAVSRKSNYLLHERVSFWSFAPHACKVCTILYFVIFCSIFVKVCTLNPEAFISIQ